MDRKRRMMVGVIGPGDVSPGDLEYDVGSRIGRLLIEMGFRVITGGLGGVMEAALKGAREATGYREGDTIGIVPGTDPGDANPFCDIVIPTGYGIGRNMVVTNADGIIAVGGGAGTLSEIAFSWQKGRPIVAMELPGWSGELAERSLDGRRGDDRIMKALTPEEAVDLIGKVLLAS